VRHDRRARRFNRRRRVATRRHDTDLVHVALVGYRRDHVDRLAVASHRLDQPRPRHVGGLARLTIGQPRFDDAEDRTESVVERGPSPRPTAPITDVPRRHLNDDPAPGGGNLRVENSFIGVDGVGERTERSLWEAGVTHWDDFDGEALGDVRAERVRTFIEAGRDAVAAGDVAFFEAAFPGGERWRCWRTFRDRACVFDIETTGLDPDRAVVTTVTVHRDGETRTLVRGDDLTDDALRAAFADADLLVSFNGKRFDVPFLENHFDVELDLPHLDCMHVARKAGLSGGLSGVEAALGIDRELPDVGGRDAVRLWHAHEAGRDGALEKLVRYNREDVTNLPVVLDRVIERLTPPPVAAVGTNR
jgi:uncharacterized protein YprB with RNaseH-like and TPR domain